MRAYRIRGSDETVLAARFSRRDPPPIAVHIGSKDGVAHYGIVGRAGWLFPRDGDWIVLGEGGPRIVPPAEFVDTYEREPLPVAMDAEAV